MESALVQAWRIHDRLVRYFIEAIPEPGWNSKAEKAKSVGDQFRHIHSVRLMWIKAIEPGALEGLAKLEGDSRPEETTQALRSSCEAIAALVEKAVESGTRIKNFKPTTEAFVGYLISHESHHRGMAEMVLRQAGTPIDDKASYGLWEWGARATELATEDAG